MNADKLIFSCKGIDIERGVTDGSPIFSLLKNTMLKSVKETILAVDNTKFNNQNPQMSALYGDVLKCSPFSIYIRRKVDIKTKNLLINIGKGKNIDVYVEKNDKCFEYYKV